jgi:hypothetical protein
MRRENWGIFTVVSRSHLPYDLPWCFEHYSYLVVVVVVQEKVASRGSMPVTGPGAKLRRASAAGIVGVMWAVLVATSGCAPAPEVAHRELYARPLTEQILDIEPVRGEMRPLVFTVDDMSVECSFCHEGFVGDLQEAALAGTHANIDFNHGMNLRCLNCHNEANADTFVDHDGSEIPSDQPILLCAKCHGPHYRDWQLGIHGRANGHWSARFGPREKLACIQCHDPHDPHFPSMAPDPPNRLTRFDRHFTLDLELPLGDSRPIPTTAGAPEDGEPLPDEAADGD